MRTEPTSARVGVDELPSLPMMRYRYGNHNKPKAFLKARFPLSDGVPITQNQLSPGLAVLFIRYVAPAGLPGAGLSII